MSQFPKAIKLTNLYDIEGVMHKRVDAAEGLANPDAIRAALPISKGPDKGGEKIVWFEKVENAVDNANEAGKLTG